MVDPRPTTLLRQTKRKMETGPRSLVSARGVLAAHSVAVDAADSEESPLSTASTARAPTTWPRTAPSRWSSATTAAASAISPENAAMKPSLRNCVDASAVASRVTSPGTARTPKPTTTRHRPRLRRLRTASATTATKLAISPETAPKVMTSAPALIAERLGTLRGIALEATTSN
ncbi:hypothetical protein GQ54DRAFT_132613 [Martensiomyces pterosporus]|nr:hypothetical protein GQ54DRAFT_132613 [Martensiomyces pterosporus]